MCRRPRFLICISNKLAGPDKTKWLVVIFYYCYFEFNLNLSPTHTNPFSNENEAVVLCFQKDLRPHLSFSYRFRPSKLQRRIRFENAFITSVRMVKWTRRMRISITRPAKLAPILDTHGRVVWRPVVSILMTSSFSDSIVFSVHTRKQRFQKASFSNRSTLESAFEWLRFRWSFSPL